MKFTISALILFATSILALPRPDSDGPSNLPSHFAVAAANVSQAASLSNQWTVIVDDDDPRSLDELMAEMGVKRSEITHIYNNSAFKGFSGRMAADNIKSMSTMSGLKIVEPVYGIKPMAEYQSNAPWGLQRLSQKTKIKNAPARNNSPGVKRNIYKYWFSGVAEGLGKGVDIYILDTGVFKEHLDFDGRAISIDAKIPSHEGSLEDDQGHGTHVAGTAASTTFGVAKNANIISVKVLDKKGGDTADIIKGIDTMVNRHEQQKKKPGFAGSVANMSLGARYRSRSLEMALLGASKKGIHCVVAAGNDNKNACTNSPAGILTNNNLPIISVGATDIHDKRAHFSNWGDDCTSLYAPGYEIPSLWLGQMNWHALSGTSMACPHVSGLVAYMLSAHPKLRDDPDGMKTLILDTAISIKIDKGTVNMAYNGVGGEGD
ncbi:peptidase S8/S53 domain-containing protein [Pyronema omphalodes]|nr:peptidase S8/S53 domain-containing protein [Pyronema omphalodes]